MIARDKSDGKVALAAPRSATMLLGSDRIFYTGRLRRSMKARRLGGISIYAVPEGAFDISIADGARQSASIVAIPPYQQHRIVPPRGPIWNLLIEPECLTETAIAQTLALCNDPEGHAMLERFKTAEAQLVPGCRADRFTTAAFDELFFGEALPVRMMDARIATVLRMLGETAAETMLSAETCAEAVSLSTSRLLHLFRQETGISFRHCRMWKRARRFLDQTAGNASLTDVALGLGYPDSSHFSHSIRRTFGMQPGVMRAGARDLNIWPGANYTMFATC